MKTAHFPARCFALLLMVSLSLPPQALALRQPTPAQSGAEEQLSARLGRPLAVSAGAEEARLIAAFVYQDPTRLEEPKPTGDTVHHDPQKVDPEERKAAQHQRETLLCFLHDLQLALGNNDPGIIGPVVMENFRLLVGMAPDADDVQRADWETGFQKVLSGIFSLYTTSIPLVGTYQGFQLILPKGRLQIPLSQVPEQGLILGLATKEVRFEWAGPAAAEGHLRPWRLVDVATGNVLHESSKGHSFFVGRDHIDPIGTAARPDKTVPSEVSKKHALIQVSAASLFGPEIPALIILDNSTNGTRVQRSAAGVEENLFPDFVRKLKTQHRWALWSFVYRDHRYLSGPKTPPSSDTVSMEEKAFLSYLRDLQATLKTRDPAVLGPAALEIFKKEVLGPMQAHESAKQPLEGFFKQLMGIVFEHWPAGTRIPRVGLRTGVRPYAFEKLPPGGKLEIPLAQVPERGLHIRFAGDKTARFEWDGEPAAEPHLRPWRLKNLTGEVIFRSQAQGEKAFVKRKPAPGVEPEAPAAYVDSPHVSEQQAVVSVTAGSSFGWNVPVLNVWDGNGEQGENARRSSNGTEVERYSRARAELLPPAEFDLRSRGFQVMERGSVAQEESDWFNGQGMKLPNVLARYEAGLNALEDEDFDKAAEHFREALNLFRELHADVADFSAGIVLQADMEPPGLRRARVRLLGVITLTAGALGYSVAEQRKHSAGAEELDLEVQALLAAVLRERDPENVLSLLANQFVILRPEQTSAVWKSLAWFSESPVVSRSMAMLWQDTRRAEVLREDLLRGLKGDSSGDFFVSLSMLLHRVPGDDLEFISSAMHGEAYQRGVPALSMVFQRAAAEGAYEAAMKSVDAIDRERQKQLLAGLKSLPEYVVVSQAYEARASDLSEAPPQPLQAERVYSGHMISDLYHQVVLAQTQKELSRRGEALPPESAAAWTSEETIQQTYGEISEAFREVWRNNPDPLARFLAGRELSRLGQAYDEFLKSRNLKKGVSGFTESLKESIEVELDNLVSDQREKLAAGSWLGTLPFITRLSYSEILPSLSPEEVARLLHPAETDPPVEARIAGRPAKLSVLKSGWGDPLRAVHLPNKLKIYVQAAAILPEAVPPLLGLLGEIAPYVSVGYIHERELSEQQRRAIIEEIKAMRESGGSGPQVLLLLNRDTLEQMEEDLQGADFSKIPAVMVSIHVSIHDIAHLAGVRALVAYLGQLLEKAQRDRGLVMDRLEDMFIMDVDKIVWLLRSA